MGPAARDRLRVRFVRTIEAMGPWLERRGRHGAAIAMYQAALAVTGVGTAALVYFGGLTVREGALSAGSWSAVGTWMGQIADVAFMKRLREQMKVRSSTRASRR